MSDTSQGAGWWLASDGKWYPPQEPASEASSTATGPASDFSTPWWKKPVPLWAVLVVALVALGLGAATASSDDEDAASADGTSVTTERGDADNGDEAPNTSTTARVTTTTQRVTTTTTAPTTTTTTAPPRPGFGGGTQVVGTDVQPGIYLTSGVSFCYWERLSGLSGEFGDIIANNNVTGQAIVEIAASDVAFNSQGCGRWELYEAPAAPATSFGEGDWIVGEQIQPGRYRADVRSWCYWERASGLTHTFGDIVANDNVQDGNAIVDISPNDRRFTSSGCGTWSPA